MKNFSDLLINFAIYAMINHITGNNETEYLEALQKLSLSCAHSVLKKVIDPRRHSKTAESVDNSGFNPALVSMKNELNRVFKELDIITKTDDDKIIDKLCQNDTGDGFDLVQTATLSILEETEKQWKRDGYIDLEKPYTVKRLKSRVRNKVDSESTKMEVVETTPIQEVYRSIRKYISDSKSVKIDPENGYTYLEDYISDDTGNDMCIYYRLPKYADIGGRVVDYNGKETSYTVDMQSVLDTESIIKSLDLTDRQMQVLIYRIKGYGIRMIGEKLNVSRQAVAKIVSQIAVKAEKIGFDYGMYYEMVNGEK